MFLFRSNFASPMSIFSFIYTKFSRLSFCDVQYMIIACIWINFISKTNNLISIRLSKCSTWILFLDLVLTFHESKSAFTVCTWRLKGARTVQKSWWFFHVFIFWDVCYTVTSAKVWLEPDFDFFRFFSPAFTSRSFTVLVPILP